MESDKGKDEADRVLQARQLVHRLLKRNEDLNQEELRLRIVDALEHLDLPSDVLRRLIRDYT